MDQLSTLIDLFKHFHEGIYIVNRQRKILYFNPQAERISGYGKDEVVGKYCNDNILNHIDEEGTRLCIIGCPLKHSMDTNQVQEGDIYLHHKDGHRVKVSVKTIPYVEEGEVVYGIEVFKEFKSVEKPIKQLKSHESEIYIDPLSELYNRRFLNDLITKDTIDFNQGVHGCLFIDMDGFKDINDQYGHDMGDQCIKNFAQTIIHFKRSEDIAIRYGGDEFLLIVKNQSYESLKKYAESLRVVLEASYIKNEWQPIILTASIGGVLFRGNEEITSAIVQSDQMMYQAKNSGKNKVVINH